MEVRREIARVALCMEGAAGRGFLSAASTALSFSLFALSGSSLSY
jgi:hypothetical protein